MNSFLKGFFSLFDWMNPKTLDESLDDLDNSMKDLYDRMGWGEYKKPSPMSGWNNAIDLTRSISSSEWNSMIKDNRTVEEVYGNVKIVTQSQFLDEMIKLIPSGCFQPYAYYNEDMDAIQVYFKDSSSYTQSLNETVEIHLSHDTNEITGATILGIKKLIENKI
jgi:hypothetical protein